MEANPHDATPPVIAHEAGDAQQRAPAGAGGWQAIRRLLVPSPAQLDHARLKALNRTIDRYPESASGYVLRGELYLSAGYYTLAADDFNAALTHAARQLQTEKWGVVAQSVQDRAQYGLQEALRLQRQHETP